MTFYYGGYKIEESSIINNSWNVYRKLSSGMWYWLWAYGSLDEAKAVVDEHLDGGYYRFPTTVIPDDWKVVEG